MRSLSVTLLTVLAAGAWTHAQQPTPTFEVASVKANTSGANQVTVSWQGSLTMINVPLRAIVQFAYNINTPSRIVGHPDWTNVERFDILARPPADATSVERMRPMLQALLADRFKMVARLEKREVRSYALVKARSDGRLGPNLKPSTTICTGPTGQPNTLAIQCARRAAEGQTMIVGVPMGQIAPLISLAVGRPVVDRTGLAGYYDLELRFAGEPVAGGLPVDPEAPSIFTALQEQLGLKLDAERELVEVLVIDRIERPTEN